MTDVTRDSIALRGADIVTLSQPANGFRFTLDSLILADFCRIKRGDRILELGAGTGIISLLLARKFPFAKIVADEYEPLAYSLLCSNIELNGLSDRIVPVDRDVQYLSRSIAPAAFDVIVANPPYGITGAGKMSPSPAKQLARHSHATSFNAWLNRQDLLKNKGRYYIIFPSSRAIDLLAMLREKGLEPKRIRFVHPNETRPASLLLVEAMKAAKTGLEVLPPLYVHSRRGGAYSDEMKGIYGSPSNGNSG